MKIKKYATISYFILFCCFLSVYIFFRYLIPLDIFGGKLLDIFGGKLPFHTLIVLKALFYVIALFFLLFLLSVISFKYNVPGISIIQNKTMLIIINILGLIGVILSLVGGYLPITMLPTTIK